MISIGALDLFSSFFMMATSSDLSVRARGFALSLPTRPPMTTTRTGKCPSTRAGHTLPHEQGRTSITTEKNGDDKPCRSPWHHISSAEDVGKRTLRQGHFASGRAGPQRHVLETVFRRAIQHRTTSIPFRAIALALPVAFGNISLSPLAICIPHLSEIRSTLATKPSQPYEGPCFERVCIAITPLISTRHHFSSARHPSAHQDTSGHKEDARQARRAIVATTEANLITAHNTEARLTCQSLNAAALDDPRVRCQRSKHVPNDLMGHFHFLSTPAHVHVRYDLFDGISTCGQTKKDVHRSLLCTQSTSSELLRPSPDAPSYILQ